MKSVRIVIEIHEPEGSPPGSVGVGVITDTMNPAELPENVGGLWYATCKALNEHFRAHGIVGFDCLKPMNLNG